MKILRCFLILTILFGGCVKKVDRSSIRRIAILEDARTLGGGKLATFLKDREIEVRCRAVMAVGRIGDKTIIPELIKLLPDRNKKVCEETIFALGQLKDTSAIAPLNNFFPQSTMEEKKLILEAMGKIGDARARQFLRNQLEIRDEQLLPTAIYALTSAKDTACLKNAVRYLKDVSLDIRRAAVSAFYRLPDSAFAEDLIPVLADSDALVRKYAVSALGKIGLSNLTPKIVPLLHDSVKSVKIQAIRAVGKCKSEIAVAELLKLVESDDYHIFREALDALGNMRPKSAEDYLENLTKKTFGLKLPYLIIALSKIEGERFIPFLDTYSDHPKPEVRRAVANSLSYITGYKALKLAQDMMLDPDPTVRVVIINSLGIQGENARANLEQALNDDDWAVRTSAVECLEKMATSSTFDKITECYLKHLNMTQPEESCIMMQVMYRLDKIRSLKYIYKGLNSPKKEIVFIARNLLKNAGEEIAPPSPPQEKDYPANFGLLLGAPKVSIMTAKGRIEVELFGDDASTVVGNFLRLVKDRFYQGLTFHRVVPDFVVQGGDPHGDGMGGPGYTIRDQINRHKFIRGTVGIANAGLDTGGSQFFICLSPQPHLDGNYTAFGQVVKGFEALDRLYEGDLIDDIVITRQVLPKFREL